MPTSSTVDPGDDRRLQTSDNAIEVHETHTGVVVLAGDRAYKTKKKIATDFLDFRTVEAREKVCAHEVTLNRRLAPDSYLGVGHFHSPENIAPEPVIVMRRYPDRIRLRSMVERGAPTEQHLRALAEVLAQFHADAECSEQIAEGGSVAKVAERWQENLSELDRYTGDVVAADAVCEARRLAMRYIAGRGPLFSARMQEHRVIDGHGDLLADDIFCTTDGPVPMDCLEFDDQLRYVDGIDDAAFLAMDLEFLGRRDLGALFLAHYRAASGDPAPASLAHFYTAYRAVVRAKVDCIRFTQGHHEARADARRHLDLALDHLQAATTRLILIGGGPGTGKTTLAHALTETLDAKVISTDVVRRELQQAGELTGVAGDLDSGLYAPGNVARVYAVVLERAGRLLSQGHSVILDGTWRDARQRGKALDVARRGSAAVVEIACESELSDARERIGSRRSATSDATAQIAEAITTGAWSGAHTVDTSRPLAESVAEAQRICCLAI